MKNQYRKGKEFKKLSSGQQVPTSHSKMGILKNEIKIFILSICVCYFFQTATWFLEQK